MAKLVIDATTGTVLNAENCYIVDASDMTDDDFTDREIAELAERVGKSIQKMGTDTGWGDNAYRFSVSYSPLSLKDEADSYIEGGVYSEGDAEFEALSWAKDTATVDELTEISESIMSDDSLWDDFRSRFISELVFAYKNKAGK